MKVTTRFDYPKIQAEKAFNLRLMLAIEGDEQPDQQRSPLNLALVLDHSGSMSGPKLRNVKEATKLLVNTLHRDDIFSLTIFDDNVTRLIPPVRIGDAHNLTRTIDAIHSGGSTYLSGGFKQGCLFATENPNKV
jgi:Ca-activated chloride channel homolog